MEDYLHTPVGEGFFLPAEWEPHSGCWVQWPSRAERWRDLMPQAYAEAAAIIRTIAEFEPVSVIVRPEDAAQARFACGRHDGIRFVQHPIDDSWARDTVPVFLSNGTDAVAGIAWQFNGWGNAVQGYRRDAALGRVLLAQENIRAFEGEMVLEGGSLSTDGYGTLLVTEDTLLNENRNPELTRGEIEGQLALSLGARKVIWLGGGLARDDAGGQVSRVAAFAGRGRVLVAEASDPHSPDRATLDDNRAHLEISSDAKGKPLQLVPVPLPARVQSGLDGMPLALSYLDYYAANGAVIVPAFGDEKDDAAAQVISSEFPDRKLIQVEAGVLAIGGGGVRRLTQPQPALPGN